MWFFLLISTTFPLFRFDGKAPFDIHSLEISSNGLQIIFHKFFNIRMLIISWLCALFGSNCSIISNVLLLENLIVDRRFSVKQWSLEFSLLSYLLGNIGKNETVVSQFADHCQCFCGGLCMFWFSCELIILS